MSMSLPIIQGLAEILECSPNENEIKSRLSKICNVDNTGTNDDGRRKLILKLMKDPSNNDVKNIVNEWKAMKLNSDIMKNKAILVEWYASVLFDSDQPVNMDNTGTLDKNQAIKEHTTAPSNVEHVLPINPFKVLINGEEQRNTRAVSMVMRNKKNNDYIRLQIGQKPPLNLQIPDEAEHLFTLTICFVVGNESEDHVIINDIKIPRASHPSEKKPTHINLGDVSLKIFYSASKKKAPKTTILRIWMDIQTSFLERDLPTGRLEFLNGLIENSKN